MQTPKIEIKAHSKSEFSQVECVTFLIGNFPYRLIQEAGTHRVIQSDSTYSNLIDNINPFTKYTSRNSASTRAIPVKKIIENIISDPYIPTFTRNIPGMQGINDLSETDVKSLTEIYLNGMNTALDTAKLLNDLGSHKQEINGVLSPYLKIPILMTATKWDNLFKLRDHDSTHPDFRSYVVEMKRLLSESEPKQLSKGQWHIPYYSRDLAEFTLNETLKICSARNARLSYNNFEGNTDPEKDLNLYEKLLDDPLHGSPFEHNLVCTHYTKDCGNFHGGWYTQRRLIEVDALTEFI